MTYTIPQTPDIDGLRRFLRTDAARYLYVLGDLDPVYKDYATYYPAVDESGVVHGLASTFEGLAPYTVSICGETEVLTMCLEAIPKRDGHFRLKCAREHIDVLSEHLTIVAKDRYQRLVFRGNPPLEKDPGVIWLTPNDMRAIEELMPFYPRAYIYITVPQGRALSGDLA